MDWALLRRELSNLLNMGDLRTICFDLELDYDDFPREKKAFLPEFLDQIRKEQLLEKLLTWLAQEYPMFDLFIFHIDEGSSSKTLSPKRMNNVDIREKRDLLRVFLGTTVEDMQAFLNEMVYIDEDQLDSNQKEEFRVRALAMHQEAARLKPYFVSDPPIKKAVHLMGNLVGSSLAGSFISEIFKQFEAQREILWVTLERLDNSLSNIN